MAEVTIQKTRKRIKVQQPFALATVILGVALLVVGGQSADQHASMAAGVNGAMTLIGGVVWLIGLRLARWWFHD